MAVMLLMLIFIHYTCQWFCHPSASLSWLVLHVMRLAKTFGQTFLKILKCASVILSQLIGIWVVVPVIQIHWEAMASYVKTHSRCFKAIL